MPAIEQVKLLIEEQCQPPSEAHQWLMEHARCLENQRWCIVQWYARLWFAPYPGQLQEFSSSLAGRIFAANAEIRWVREGDKYRLWLLKEDSLGAPFRRRSRRYYLWGWWNDKEKRFVELRIPEDRALAYPMAHLTPKPMDRLFIQVYEYLPVPPGRWPTTAEALEEFTRLVNQPAVVAHRFYAVGCGQDTPASLGGKS